jgi:pyocin large subunit-like protein
MRKWVIALVLLALLPFCGALHIGSTASALTNSAVSPKTATPPPTRKIWGNMATLRDHFQRHGGDFRAKDPDDYARMAWEFLQRARKEGLPAKVDSEKVLRVYDPKTRSFAAYNSDETAKTFFKARNREYFERQPGKAVDLKTWK